MTPGARAARTAWLGAWRALMRYHRYEVRGFDELETGRSMLIVGYHGRPIAHDLCMLTVRVHDALGYLPHPIFHRGFARNAVLRAVLDGVGGVTGDDGSLAAAVARGEHIVVTPGGTREGCRPHTDRYRVDWGRRSGYLRLAMKYRLPLVPVAATGIDDMYIGLNHGDTAGRRAGLPHGLPLWLGVGPLGLWPASPPFPVKVTQYIGAPIELPPVDPRDREALGALHAHVTGAVQGLLDRGRVGT